MGDVASLSIKVTQEGADQAAASLRGLTQAGTGAENSFGKLAMQIAGLTTGYNLAVQAGQKTLSVIKDLSVQSVQLAAGFEKSRITWGVLVGDMDKGTAVFEQIRQFSAETPLSFEGLNQAATTIKGFGVATEDLIPTLSKLGDVAMGDNNKLQSLALVYGQVMAQGKAKTQDLYQFINAGIPIFNLLSQSMNISAGSIKDLAADGAITFEEIEKAITKATSEGGQFYGMMDKVAESASGKWSTAVDNWEQALARIGDKTLPALTAALDVFNKTINGIVDNQEYLDFFKNPSAFKGDFSAVERVLSGMKTLNESKPSLTQGTMRTFIEERLALLDYYQKMNKLAETYPSRNRPTTTTGMAPVSSSDFMLNYYREGRTSSDPLSEIFMSDQGISSANSALQEYFNLVNQITAAAENSPWAKEEAELSSGTVTAMAEQTQRASDITAQYADRTKTLQSQLSEVNLLYKNGAIDGRTYVMAVEDLQNQIDKADPAMVKFQESMQSINNYFGQLGQQAFVDSFKSIGEAFVSLDDGAQSFQESLDNLTETILNNLPLLLLQAGISAMAVNPYAGLALIAASGVVAIGAGVYDAASSGTEDNANGGVYSSRSLHSYANGVYDKPQLFNFARGSAIGRFGEAGPEAIMPLTRVNGRLGVVASGSGGSNVSVVVNNNAPNTTATATETTAPDGSRQIAVIVKSLVKQGMANGEFDGAMSRFGARAVGVRK